MRVLDAIPDVRAILTEARRHGSTVGLVPTMGAFHEGHLSLMRRARDECDVVVVSLFVNPAQFNDPADLTAYPRDPQRDTALAAELGVDYLFAPAADEIYPPGFATTVSLGGVTETLEGAHRGRGHFEGVATVVAKLFNIVGPDVAYFGQKDAQQATVIKRLVRDLNLPVRIEVCPTVRDPDGLALSSRNALLSPAERARATALCTARSRAMQEAVQAASAIPSSSAPARSPNSERRDRPRLRRARLDRHPRPLEPDRRRGPRRCGRKRREYTPYRQPADPTVTQPRPRGGDPHRGANRRVKERTDNVRNAPHPDPAEPRLAPADDASPPGREEAPRRGDRDGHGLRLSLRSGGRGGRGRPRAGRRLGRHDRARLPQHGAGVHRRDADVGRRGPARPADAALDRRSAVRVLRGLGRAGHRHRAALRQGSRLRRGQARAWRDERAARPGDRRGGDPGHGPHRPDSPDRDRARRLPGPGPQRGARARRGPRRDRAAGGGLLLARIRGHSGGGRTSAHAAARDSGDRDRRRGGDGRPGARVPRPAGHLRRPRPPVRQALRRPARADGRRRDRVRGRGSSARLPRPGARIFDRRRRAACVRGRAGDHRSISGLAPRGVRPDDVRPARRAKHGC